MRPERHPLTSVQAPAQGPDTPTITIYLDADACPVKEHVYRVAARFGVPLKVVSGARLRVPAQPGTEAVAAGSGVDAADDWIAERATAGDVVLTADIPLAARVLRSGAECLDFRGEPFRAERIGDMLASRDLNAYLRSMGMTGSQPKAYSDRDRGRFASRLDALVRKKVAATT
ncbi:MAG: YaiI/YqxD family protein [Chloroflexota bacterium]|nr:YaiI/YqxD family protein [Chloroflexota bacterium]